jgi:hypothetical protein
MQFGALPASVPLPLEEPLPASVPSFVDEPLSLFDVPSLPLEEPPFEDEPPFDDDPDPPLFDGEPASFFPPLVALLVVLRHVTGPSVGAAQA